MNATADDLIFNARLTPHRSLGPLGFRILMAFVGFVCFAVGLMFFLMGLWPVVGFMGLDVLIVYLAFRASYRSARAYEDVEISRQHVLLRKVSPKGRETDHAFPQFGTRFEVDRHEEIGITDMRVVNRNRAVKIGTFLNPNDRESFAHAFSRALARAKR